MRHVHVLNSFASLREAEKTCTTGNPRLIWGLARGRGRSTAALMGNFILTSAVLILRCLQGNGRIHQHVTNNGTDGLE